MNEEWPRQRSFKSWYDLPPVDIQASEKERLINYLQMLKVALASYVPPVVVIKIFGEIINTSQLTDYLALWVAWSSQTLYFFIDFVISSRMRRHKKTACYKRFFYFVPEIIFFDKSLIQTWW